MATDYTPSNKDIYFCNTSKIFKEWQQKRNN